MHRGREARRPVRAGQRVRGAALRAAGDAQRLGLYGFGAAVGFSLVLVLFAAVRERVAVADVPEPFQGNAIALITAGLMSMAFMGFAGLVSY